MSAAASSSCTTQNRDARLVSRYTNQPAQMPAGLRDRIDLWYSISASTRLAAVKRLLKTALKVMKHVSGATLAPRLSLAIRKRGRS